LTKFRKRHLKDTDAKIGHKSAECFFWLQYLFDYTVDNTIADKD